MYRIKIESKDKIDFKVYYVVSSTPPQQYSNSTLQTQAALVDLAVETVGVKATRSACRAEVDNIQHLGGCPGVCNSIAIDRGQDVVSSVGVVDTHIINSVDSLVVKHVTSSSNGVDNGSDIDTIWSHNIAVLNEGSANVTSVVSFNSQDACRSEKEMSEIVVRQGE